MATGGLREGQISNYCRRRRVPHACTERQVIQIRRLQTHRNVAVSQFAVSPGPIVTKLSEISPLW